MHTSITNEIKEVMDAVHYRPAISLLIPFETKMSGKAELTQLLKNASDKVDRELAKNYPDEMRSLMMQKLKKIITPLNYITDKKSIAIYLSPVFEKVIYLDIAVKEKIIVDESFEIRDLVENKKESQQYLVLLLSNKHSSIYLGSSTLLTKIVNGTPDNIQAYENDIAEKTGNFSDESARKEIMMEKFLRHIDHSLDILLPVYHLPFFVMGTERILGHFKKHTRHHNLVVDYITGNYEEITTTLLMEKMEVHWRNWEKNKQKELLNKLSVATDNRKLVSGMEKVWKEAINQKGKLLVVERNYQCPAQLINSTGSIEKEIEPSPKFSYLKDAVDDVIEKVLVNGGDVEFVDDGTLADYQHIALILFYQ